MLRDWIRSWGLFSAMLLFSAMPLGADDCNENGVDDIQDIANGTSRDCNSNTVPDECDVGASRIAFEQGIPYSTEGRPGRIALGDFDADGDLDIVTEDRELFLNQGDGTFEGPTALMEGDARFADSIEALDLDGDGDLDLASRVSDSGTVSTLLGNGDGTFGPPADIEVGERPRSLVSGDADGDGDMDLVVVADRGSSVVVLQNDGTGTFTKTAYHVPSGSRRLRLADLDGDDRLDIVVTQLGSREEPGSSVAVLLGTAGGSFSEAKTYVAGDRPLSVEPADVDGDGDLDLVVLNLSSEDVSILTNPGDGNFEPPLSYPVGRQPEYLEVADVDLDGDLDVVSTGPNIDLDIPGSDPDDVSILLGRGDGTFDPAVNIVVEGNPWDLLLPDLDRDGDPDILTVNQNGGVAVVIQNLGGGSFSGPEYLPVTYGGAVDAATGDLDGDGDLDVVVGTTGHSMTVFRNVSSQEIEIGCDPFVRGDVNADGTVSISDMVMLRRWMFEGTADLDCWDSADVVDDDRIDICDEVEILWLLFANPEWSEAMPAPFPEPGYDPTPEAIPGRSHTCPDIYERAEGHNPLPIGCLHYEVTPPEDSADVLRIENVTGVPGQEVLIPVYLRPSVQVDATQIVVTYDPDLLQIESGYESLDFTGSFYEQFFGRTFTIVGCGGNCSSTFTYGDRPFCELTAYPDEGVAVAGIIGSLGFEGFEIPAGDEVLVANIRARVSEEAPPEAETPVVPVGGSGTAGVGPFSLKTEISYRGAARYVSTLPVVRPGILAIVGDQSFFRGDSNGDDDVDLSDAIYTLDSLFLGGSRLDCDDAADANDDGRLDIADPIYTLGFLFLDGPPLPPPHEEEGMDPTDDALHCFRMD